MSNRLAKFYRMGYTSKSEIPAKLVGILKDYHPAFTPSPSTDFFQLKTEVKGSRTNQYVKMVPIIDPNRNDWNGTNDQLFYGIRLKYLSTNQLQAASLNIPFGAQAVLKKFDLHYRKNGSNVFFEAQLWWNINRVSFSQPSKWFWIPD